MLTFKTSGLSVWSDCSNSIFIIKFVIVETFIWWWYSVWFIGWRYSVWFETWIWIIIIPWLIAIQWRNFLVDYFNNVSLLILILLELHNQIMGNLIQKNFFSVYLLKLIILFPWIFVYNCPFIIKKNFFSKLFQRIFYKKRCI